MMRILISILALAAVIWSPVWADEYPDLVGNWTSTTGLTIKHGSGQHFPDIIDENINYTNSSFAMAIEEQRGQAFSGKWFRAENPLIVENLFGMIAFGNDTFYMVDEDGYFDGRIISPTEVEVVYRETSPEFMVISIFKFVKSS